MGIGWDGPTEPRCESQQAKTTRVKPTDELVVGAQNKNLKLKIRQTKLRTSVAVMGAHD